MSNARIPICLWCRHFDAKGFDESTVWRCAAFPERIPREIVEGDIKHLAPFPEDRGIQFEKQPDRSKLPELLIHGLKGTDPDEAIKQIMDNIDKY